jgi:two-component system, OmpR family, heavy metal sensor histidine kinase CusS
MRRSLTLRLTLFFSVVSTIVLCAIGYVIDAAVDQHFVELDRADLRAKKELVRHALAKQRSPADLGELPQHLEELLIGDNDVWVRIAGPQGQILYSSPHAGFPPRWLADEATPPTGEELATWETRRHEGSDHDGNGHQYRGLRTRLDTASLPYPVTLALGINIDAHHVFMHAFYRTLWIAIALGIVATGLLGWFAARRGLTPVRTMAEVAHNITASRLDDRLSLETLPVELVDLAEAFNAMLARLQDSFRRLSEFSSDLAHELRTPVSNLVTHTQVALSRSRSADEYREVLYSNIEEFERLARMISDMLFLAKADNGLIVPRSEVVDLAHEVRDLFDYYDAYLEERGVRAEVSGEGCVHGERLMIRRAISNLLSNAANHTPRGECVSVRIDRDDGGAIRVSVENRGETIPAEHLPRLFDRFYRVDPARQRLSEGAGLGLAITKSIVAAHRGMVRAFSTDGVTRIEILFPAASAAGRS